MHPKISHRQYNLHSYWNSDCVWKHFSKCLKSAGKSGLHSCSIKFYYNLLTCFMWKNDWGVQEPIRTFGQNTFAFDMPQNPCDNQTECWVWIFGAMHVTWCIVLQPKYIETSLHCIISRFNADFLPTDQPTDANQFHKSRFYTYKLWCLLSK